jgi:hypothetical protein
MNEFSPSRFSAPARRSTEQRNLRAYTLLRVICGYRLVL